MSGKYLVSPMTCLVLFTCCVQAQAVVTALDDFSSGTLTGGTNWENDWSGGSVGNSANFGSEVLMHTGNNPQQISRRFAPTVDNTAPFTVCFDFAIEVDETQGGNYGFRSYIESANNSVYSLAWKNDINGGNLTFFYGNNQSLQITDPEWNMALGLSTIESHTYQFCFDIVPAPGQNPGQWGGAGSTYAATITRDDSVAISTGPLAWNNGGNGISTGQFDEIYFFNSSGKTTTEFDNIQIGDSAQVPEPSGALLGLASALLFWRRRR